MASPPFSRVSVLPTAPKFVKLGPGEVSTSVSRFLATSVSTNSTTVLGRLWATLSIGPASYACSAPTVFTTTTIRSVEGNLSRVFPAGSGCFAVTSTMTPGIYAVRKFPIASSVSSVILVLSSTTSLSGAPTFSSLVVLYPP